MSGVAGLVLLAFCAMFYFPAVIPMGKEVRSLTSEAATQVHPRRETGQVSPDRQLESFYQAFSKVKGATDALEKLYDAAMLQGVTLEQGEYHLVHGGA
jgi:hypothetical protein